MTNEKQVPIMDFAKQIKENVINKIRILEAEVSRKFDDIFGIMNELINLNVELSQENDNLKIEIKQLKEEKNANQVD